MTPVEALLAAEDSAWTHLHSCFEQIPRDRFEEPTVTPQGWAPRDVMFHVGAWLADCARVLERIREGTFDREEETADIEAQNRAWFEVSRELDPHDVHAGFEGARQKARECLAQLPELTPDAREWFEESGALHYPKHVADLRAWLAS